jgi:hypothetical protein
MSAQEAMTYFPDRVGWRSRVLVQMVVCVARLLARLSPNRLRRVLGWLARRARPADHPSTLRARETVAAVNLACSGPQGCLPRSIATALLCRLSGAWPVWCVGVRVVPPFGAHAWVEAEGRPVNEPHPPGYYHVLLSVAAGPGAGS